jgi:hypothetical protein
VGTFRDRLLATLRAAEPVLRVPGVLVVGSEVPNLLEPGAAATLVVSQDVDLAIPVDVHELVKESLEHIVGLEPSPDEPSVWVPRAGRTDLIELNFLGLDPAIVDPMDSYEKPDDRLPLMVFGPLSLLSPGDLLEIDGLHVPMPRPDGLVVEKLVTDRSGEKGDRDLLVVAGLLPHMSEDEIGHVIALIRGLAPELRHAVRSNLTILSLLETRPSMPDPRVVREVIARLLDQLEER